MRKSFVRVVVSRWKVVRFKSGNGSKAPWERWPGGYRWHDHAQGTLERMIRGFVFGSAPFVISITFVKLLLNPVFDTKSAVLCVWTFWNKLLFVSDGLPSNVGQHPLDNASFSCHSFACCAGACAVRSCCFGWCYCRPGFSTCGPRSCII